MKLRQPILKSVPGDEQSFCYKKPPGTWRPVCVSNITHKEKKLHFNIPVSLWTSVSNPTSQEGVIKKNAGHGENKADFMLHLIFWSATFYSDSCAKGRTWGQHVHFSLHVSWVSVSLVQAELGAVVQAHVRVAEQATRSLPQGAGVHSAQLLLWQAQVAAHLGTSLHLGDVEAVLSTCVRAHGEMWARAPRWLNVRFGYRVWVSPSRSAMLSKNSQSVSRGPFLTKLT